MAVVAMLDPAIEHWQTAAGQGPGSMGLVAQWCHFVGVAIKNSFPSSGNRAAFDRS